MDFKKKEKTPLLDQESFKTLIKGKKSRWFKKFPYSISENSGATGTKYLNYRSVTKGLYT